MFQNLNLFLRVPIDVVREQKLKSLLPSSWVTAETIVTKLFTATILKSLDDALKVLFIPTHSLGMQWVSVQGTFQTQVVYLVVKPFETNFSATI